MNDFAILASVPLEHLESGRVVAAEKGFVAFGSEKFELFRDIEQRRKGKQVLSLIYASHDQDAKGTPKVSWVGWYIDRKESNNGRHPRGMEHRPPTTTKNATDNRGHWAVFWHVRQLEPLAAGDCLRISELYTLKGARRKPAAPRGPELVDFPASIKLPG